MDVYVSTVGGIRFTEPAADLAIAIAVAGSVGNWPVAHDRAAVGELSLAGEVRPVTQAERRRHEAARLGYSRVVDDRSGTLAAALGDIRSGNRANRLGEVPQF
jgi:DNA repair protein RadA/Sms